MRKYIFFYDLNLKSSKQFVANPVKPTDPLNKMLVVKKNEQY